jgi:hypothetical protein
LCKLKEQLQKTTSSKERPEKKPQHKRSLKRQKLAATTSCLRVVYNCNDRAGNPPSCWSITAVNTLTSKLSCCCCGCEFLLWEVEMQHKYIRELEAEMDGSGSEKTTTITTTTTTTGANTL